MRSRPLNRRVIAVAVAAIVLPAAAQRQDKPARDDNGRLPDVANPAPTMFKSSIRTRDPKAPKPVLGPGPDSVAIRAGGKVLDLKGNPIPGATVYLIGTHLRFKPRLEIKSSVAATAKTREDGFYSFHDAKLPTSPDTGSEGAGTPYVLEAARPSTVRFTLQAKKDGK